MTEDDLVNKVGLMFMDAMSVRCEPNSYARAVIKMVDEHRLATLRAQPPSALAGAPSAGEARKWPDWRTASADKAIEHDRSGESAPSPTPDREKVLEATVTAWMIAVEGLEAYLMDRVAMDGASDPKTYLAILRSKTYLAILRSGIKRIREDSTAIVNARWEDVRRYEGRIAKLTAAIAALEGK
jgi:hypothetical protein